MSRTMLSVEERFARWEETRRRWVRRPGGPAPGETRAPPPLLPVPALEMAVVEMTGAERAQGELAWSDEEDGGLPLVPDIGSPLPDWPDTPDTTLPKMTPGSSLVCKKPGLTD